MVKILHFSPVRKSPDIVKLHLESLKKISSENFEFHLSFFDDNYDQKSSLILKEFVDSNKNTFFHHFDLNELPDYNGEQRWHPYLYDRIILIKNMAINYFLANNYDYLFLTDADLVIHPKTVETLFHSKKDFIASIFWTHFDRSPTFTPNAWYAKHLGFEKTDLIKLKENGTFPVDFTGACTLLSRNILQKGVSFQRIPVLTYLGEDKHFCIRASAFGFQAYVNTENPAFHLYNELLIKDGKKLLESDFELNYLDDWLNKNWEEKIENWLKPSSKNILQRLKAKIFK